MHWWCMKCKTWAINDPQDPHITHHKTEVVGIREDILKDHMRRIVWELDITNRLTRLK